jgi:hypothetical protein
MMTSEARVAEASIDACAGGGGGGHSQYHHRAQTVGTHSHRFKHLAHERRHTAQLTVAGAHARQYAVAHRNLYWECAK